MRVAQVTVVILADGKCNQMESPDDIFLNARQIADTVEQDAYLDKACGGDAVLRQRIDAMLRDAEGADIFFGAKGTIASVTAPSLTEGPNTAIGRYKLLQRIGKGGMGVVYMAEQREPVVRKVALKIIKLGMNTKQVVARFEAERQALALMDHPNIAKVLDGGETETGRPYFVMELVQGLPVTQFCDDANLPTCERLRLFMEICSAVQHAHQKGIIHRDLKPSNILVTMHGDKPVPKVIDFGVAKATQGRLTDKTVFTQFHQFIGTPAYMSPEQTSLSGFDVDTRSDIYSLGVLLYELLTSKTPFDANELLKVGLDHMRQVICEQEPPKPSTRLSTMQGGDLTVTAERRHTEPPKLVNLVRGDLDWIVMKCLEKERSRRYETANGLAMDLQRHLDDEPIVARPPSTAYRIRKAIRRNKLAFAAVGGIALALLAGIATSSWQAVRASRAEHEANSQTAAARKLQGEIDQDRNLYRDFWLATGYERRGQTNEAIELFTKLYPQLAESFPQHRADCEETAKFFVRMGLYDDARAAYETIRASLEIDLPNEPADFQMLVEATAASKGWLAAAETCREHFDLLANDPIAWRTKAITLLYAGDEESYARAASAVITRASAATTWESSVALLETVGLRGRSFSAEETNALASVMASVRDGFSPEREGQGRAAIASVLFRMDRFDESLRQTQIALDWQRDRMGKARLSALGALCRQRLGNAKTAYENFINGDANTRFTSLWNIEALSNTEPFLTEPERAYVILRREELATIPGTRVDSLARQSKFREAAEEATRSIVRESTNHWHYHSLAPLLLVLEDPDGYRALCGQSVSQFKDTGNFLVATHLLNACLTLPDSGTDPMAVSNWIAIVRTANPGSASNEANSWYSRALAAYRQGDFAVAKDLAERTVNFAASLGGDFAYVEARMVLAMAQYQLQSPTDARATLAEGLRRAELQAQAVGQRPGDLGFDWRARLRERALMKEARALIEGK